MSDEQKFGHKSDERVRWRHIVMVLDEYAPTWRELAYDKQNDDPIAWLGDAAVQTVIAALKRPSAPPAPEQPKGNLMGYITRRVNPMSNTPVDFETAKERAINWAGMNPKGTFAVYAVTEVGRAKPIKPLVEWKDAT